MLTASVCVELGRTFVDTQTLWAHVGENGILEELLVAGLDTGILILVVLDDVASHILLSVLDFDNLVITLFLMAAELLAIIDKFSALLFSLLVGKRRGLLLWGSLVSWLDLVLSRHPHK